MVTVYGASVDLVEIVGSRYRNREIPCYEKDVSIRFMDGTVILVGYPKEQAAIWWINVVKRGDAPQSLTICNDENAERYSDEFHIDAEVISHEVIGMKYYGA